MAHEGAGLSNVDNLPHTFKEFQEAMKSVKPNVASSKFRHSSITLGLKGSVGLRMNTSRGGHSSMFVSSPRKVHLMIDSLATDVFLYCPRCTNYTNCACGSSPTKNGGQHWNSWLASGRADYVWTSSPFWSKACEEPKSRGKQLFVISMDDASASDSVKAEVLEEALIERWLRQW